MAIKPNALWAGQTTVDAEYPLGKARNVSVPGDGSGTPLSQEWVNDLWGFQQALLARAGITESEDPDTALVSQYCDAIEYLAAHPDDLEVANDAIIGNDLEVLGTLTAPSIAAGATVEGDFFVGDNIFVTDDVFCNDLDIEDDLVVGDDASIGGDLEVGNDIDAGGDIDADGFIDAGQDITAGGSVVATAGSIVALAGDHVGENFKYNGTPGGKSIRLAPCDFKPIDDGVYSTTWKFFGQTGLKGTGGGGEMLAAECSFHVPPGVELVGVRIGIKSPGLQATDELSLIERSGDGTETTLATTTNIAHTNNAYALRQIASVSHVDTQPGASTIAGMKHYVIRYVWKHDVAVGGSQDFFISGAQVGYAYQTGGTLTNAT